MKFLIQELIKLLLLYYSKENIITKLQKLYSLPRNLRAGNKSPALFLKKPLCTGDILPTHKIFIERPVEYQRLSGQHFLVKSLLSRKRTGLVVHAKFASWLNVKLIDWVMLRRNVSGMDMTVVTNVPNNAWWHYVLTLVLDFIISTRIILLSINLGRDKIVITDYVAIYMHGVK